MNFNVYHIRQKIQWINFLILEGHNQVYPNIYKLLSPTAWHWAKIIRANSFISQTPQKTTKGVGSHCKTASNYIGIYNEMSQAIIFLEFTQVTLLQV